MDWKFPCVEIEIDSLGDRHTLSYETNGHSHTIAFFQGKSGLQMAEAIKAAILNERKVSALVSAAELVAYNLAGEVGSKTNSELPSWLVARIQGLQEALTKFRNETGESKTNTEKPTKG